MNNFVIYTPDGAIRRVVSCPNDEIELQLQPGEQHIPGWADPMNDSVDLLTSKVLKGGKPKPPSRIETYADIRRRMYPSTAEQLDMLWHAMDQNPQQRMEPFYSTIKAVKDAVPKATGKVFDVGGV